MPFTRTLMALVFVLLSAVGSADAAEGKLGKELYDAVLSQDVTQITALIEQGADVNHKENGRPILGWAAQQGSVQVVEALLNGGANPDIADDSAGHTPLIRAIETEQVGVIKALLKAKANPNVASKDGKTALVFAIESHKPQVVQALILMGADVKQLGADGTSPALVAAQDAQPQSLEVIRILGKAGANLDASNVLYTPLIYAITQNNVDLVKVLLEAGANPSAQSASGDLPLVAALDNQQILQLLIDNKADVNAQGTSGTALEQAVRTANIQAVTLLLKSGANKDIKDKSGMTLLEIAQQNHYEDIAQLLAPAAGEGSSASQQAGCNLADAAKKQMEIHGLLQAQVDAGKMDTDIFKTFNEDTKDYARLLVENPNEACELLERLRKKYGL